MTRLACPPADCFDPAAGQVPSRRPARRWISLAASLALASGAAQALVISEGTMEVAEWTQIIVTQSGPATLVITAPPVGGNPDSNWLHHYTVPVGNALPTRIREANIYSAATYDPGISGALASLTINFDVQVAFTSFSDGSAGFLIPALTQGGHVYRQAIGATSVISPNWSPRSFSSTSAADWGEQDTNLHPDFSAAGGAMQFGYLFSLGTTCPSTAGCNASASGSALDNFHVVALAASVPEPASGLMLLAGALLLGWRRLRQGAAA